MNADKKINGDLHESQQPIDLTIGAVSQRQDMIELEGSIAIRKYWNPICHRLWDVSVPHMINHQSDLMSDAVELAKARTGDRFLWGWRVTGTTLIKFRQGRPFNKLSVVTCPPNNWYVIDIVDHIGFHACGHVVWMAADSYEHIYRVIAESRK